jgi:aspartate carbamoyltransferase catalytic subunit
MMFFEPSTRTRLSFELAVNRLGGDLMTFEPGTASTKKGESLRDTALTVTAMGAAILVVRHSEAGVPDAMHDWTGVPVVNAGDGAHEHPTQALLDVVTLYRRFGSLQGLRMGIVGDIRQSRVAGSLFHAMPVLGVDSVLIGPESLLPEHEPDGFEMSTDLDSHLGDLDVLYLLRVQRERGTLIPDDYIERFRVDSERAAAMKPEAVVMHPGPINRDVEITGDVADGPRSLILSQVANGVPTRMAVLTALRDGIT